MKSLSPDSKRVCILGLFLVIFWGALIPVAMAQSPTEEQAMRAKIDQTIRIADELVERGVFQQAQLKLLHDRRYQHPSYWSPFLLINNWL